MPDWRNQNNISEGGTTPTTLRIPTAVKGRLVKIARKNNTTITAIIRYSLEKFLEENDPQQAPKAAPTAPATSSLFS